jgi:hypothetical protein
MKMSWRYWKNLRKQHLLVVIIAIAALPILLPVLLLVLIVDFFFKCATRGRRARKDAAVDELARRQLLPNEKLLCVDRHRASVVGLLIALIAMSTGLTSLVMSVAIFVLDDVFMFMGRLIFFLAFGSIGVLMVYWGLSVFRLAKKYFFVTDRRLAVRSFTTWAGKQIADDYPAEQLLRFYEIYRSIQLFIGVGKKRPKMITLMPENNAQHLASAILLAMHIGNAKNEPAIKRGKCVYATVI